MPNLIHHIVEPRRLLLAWQAPTSDTSKERTRWAVGQVSRDGDSYTLEYFNHSEFQIRNSRSLDAAAKLGFVGYPAFNYKTKVHTSGVLEAFLRRLPPRTRPDFFLYRKQFCISERVHISDFALLGLTEAKLPSDGFSLVDPLDNISARREVLLEVAGYRHYSFNLSFSLSAGEQVYFFPEPTNPFDHNAVRVVRGDETIGYVNRHQAPTFLSWIREGRVSGEVERLNGTADKPRAYVFVRVAPASSSIAA